MRRVVLLALLALALPVVAAASSIDFVLGGGSMTVTSSTATISSTNILLFSTDNGVTFSSTTGTASLSFNLSGSTITGGSITITSSALGGVVFNGTFTSGTFTTSTGSLGTEFSFNAVATGTLTVNGQSVPTSLTIATGQTIEGSCSSSESCTLPFVSGDVTINIVPEPGTLGLLGTGLVGLAGLVRRKLRG